MEGNHLWSFDSSSRLLLFSRFLVRIRSALRTVPDYGEITVFDLWTLIPDQEVGCFSILIIHEFSINYSNNFLIEL